MLRIFFMKKKKILITNCPDNLNIYTIGEAAFYFAKEKELYPNLYLVSFNRNDLEYFRII